MTYRALDDGVGKRMAEDEVAAAKLVFISRILTLLTIGFTKCSVILFLRGFFTGTVNKGWKICTGFMIATGLWTIASALAITVGCPPSTALRLQSSSQCTGDVSVHA